MFLFGGVIVAMFLQEKPREPHFITCFLNIFLYLPSVLSKSKLPVHWWHDVALYQCIFGRVIEICHREPLYLLSCHHPVLSTYVNVIA